MKEQLYKPSGELQGDTKPMPDRGTGSGMPGNAELGGMSTDQDATNGKGSIKRSTKSDPLYDCHGATPII